MATYLGKSLETLKTGFSEPQSLAHTQDPLGTQQPLAVTLGNPYVPSRTAVRPGALSTTDWFANRSPGEWLLV
jgi:hypothetical protein